MRRRVAYTLIETLAAMAMIATVMTTVALSMSGMHRACRQVQGEMASEMDLQRLAAQLRADAHGALSAEQESAEAESETAGSMRLLLGEEESVRYTVTADSIQREHLRDEKVLHRDNYRIPERYTARWLLEETESAFMVSLKLEPGSEDLNGPIAGHTLQINAAVGLLKRSTAPSKS